MFGDQIYNSTLSGTTSIYSLTYAIKKYRYCFNGKVKDFEATNKDFPIAIRIGIKIYNDSSDNISGVLKHASATAVLHSKVNGYDAHNEAFALASVGESFSIGRNGKDSRTYKSGSLKDGEEVNVTGSYYDQSQVNREGMVMEGIGGSGNDQIWAFQVFVRSSSDPIIMKVPTNIFGGLKWNSAVEYAPSSLEVIYKKKKRTVE